MANSKEETCDITFNPPKGDDSVVGGATSNQHAEEQGGTENKTDRLRPRPILSSQSFQLKQCCIQIFKCNLKIYMYVQVAHSAALTYYDQVAVGNPK